MKYKSYVILSNTIGIAVGIIAYIILSFTEPDLALLLSILSALVAILLLFPIFIITEKIENLKYIKFEKTLTDKIIHTIGANIKTESGVKYAKIYLTEKGLIIAAAFKRNVVGEFLPFQNIYKIVTDKIISIEIYTRDNKMLNMASPETEEFLSAINKVSQVTSEYKD